MRLNESAICAALELSFLKSIIEAVYSQFPKDSFLFLHTFVLINKLDDIQCFLSICFDSNVKRRYRSGFSFSFNARSAELFCSFGLYASNVLIGK